MEFVYKFYMDTIGKTFVYIIIMRSGLYYKSVVYETSGYEGLINFHSQRISFCASLKERMKPMRKERLSVIIQPDCDETVEAISNAKSINQYGDIPSIKSLLYFGVEQQMAEEVKPLHPFWSYITMKSIMANSLSIYFSH